MALCLVFSQIARKETKTANWHQERGPCYNILDHEVLRLLDVVCEKNMEESEVVADRNPRMP